MSFGKRDFIKEHGEIVRREGINEGEYLYYRIKVWSILIVVHIRKRKERSRR